MSDGNDSNQEKNTPNSNLPSREDIKKIFNKAKGPSDTSRTPFQNMPKMGSAWVRFGEGIRNVKNGLGRAVGNIRNNSESSWNGIGFIFIIVAILAVAYFVISEYFVYLLPLVVIVLLFRTEFIRKSPIMQFILILIAFGVIIMLFAPLILNDTGIINQDTFSKIATKIATSTAGLVTGFDNFDPVTNWNNFWDKQVAVATGSYFEGQVEENKDDEKLGIFIENIEASTPIILENEEVTFWARLRGKTLENNIEVEMGCNSSKSNENKESVNEEFNIYSYEQKDIDCKFSGLESGATKITFWANYNFETLAYNKAYFMDQDRIRALRKQGLDPLNEYDIRDTDPIAVYTNGPVHIGIGTTYSQPIAIKPNGERLAVLGVTLENKWEGKIKKVTNLEIQVPKSIELKDCDYTFVESGTDGCLTRCQGIEECKNDCNNYWFYQLSDEGLDKIGTVDKYQTFKCGIYAYSSSDILDGSPISTKYFRVIAEYDYLAEAYRTFYIKKEEY